MPEYEHILVDHEDGVAIVTLNRPEVLNAMNNKLSAELHDAIVQADANDDVDIAFVYIASDSAERRRRFTSRHGTKLEPFFVRIG